MLSHFDDLVVLPQSVFELYAYIKKMETLEAAKKLLFSPKLVQIDELDTVLRNFEELSFKDCNAYQILRIMRTVHNSYVRAFNEICGE
jgi:hypothetical protein